MAINFTSRSRVDSLNKLAEGGEAVIYELDSKTVIKILKKKLNTLFLLKTSFQRMLLDQKKR